MSFKKFPVTASKFPISWHHEMEFNKTRLVFLSPLPHLPTYFHGFEKQSYNEGHAPVGGSGKGTSHLFHIRWEQLT